MNTTRSMGGGKWHRRTDWVRCTVFYPNLVEVVTRPEVKGRLCYVEGRLQVETRHTEKARKTYYSVVVDRMSIMDSKATQVREPGSDETEFIETDVPGDEGEPVNDDDVPF